MTALKLCGEPVRLLAEGALFRVETKTLFLADPHFGKPEAFRALNVPVPAGTTAAALLRLSSALEKSDAERLVILGDFWHAKSSRTPEVEAELLVWRESFPSLQIDVTLGNHDRAAGGPPAGWADAVSRDVLVYPPFVASHYPDASPLGYTLAGHLHPGFTLSGKGRQRLTLPCFWFAEPFAVLPAFGEFTGLSRIAPNPGDRIYVIAGEEVLSVT